MGRGGERNDSTTVRNFDEKYPGVHVYSCVITCVCGELSALSKCLKISLMRDSREMHRMHRAAVLEPLKFEVRRPFSRLNETSAGTYDSRIKNVFSINNRLNI